MSRLTIPLIAVGSIALAACSDGRDVTPTGTPFAASLAKAPPPSPDPTATFAFPTNDAGLSLKSDYLFVTAGNSLYANGECGVTAKIFYGSGASGDATMQTNNPTASDRKCLAYPRKMTIAYSDGMSETIPIFMNVREVENTIYTIPIGSTVKRGFSINPTQKSRCDVLWWNESAGTGSARGDGVLVTRVAGDTWRVQTQPFPDDKALCSDNQVAYHMPLDFTVTTTNPLP